MCMYVGVVLPGPDREHAIFIKYFTNIDIKHFVKIRMSGRFRCEKVCNIPKIFMRGRNIVLMFVVNFFIPEFPGHFRMFTKYVISIFL